MDRASATETVDSGSILGRVKPKTIKLVFTLSLLDVQQLKGQCEASTVCGRQVGRRQLASKTERSLRCLLAQATWWIKCNYNYTIAWCHLQILSHGVTCENQTGLNIPGPLNGATATPDSISSSPTLMLCHQECIFYDASGPAESLTHWCSTFLFFATQHLLGYMATNANVALGIKRLTTNNRLSALFSTSRYRWADPTGLGHKPAGCKKPFRTFDEKLKRPNLQIQLNNSTVQTIQVKLNQILSTN